MKIVVFIQSADDEINPMSIESLVASQQMCKQTNGELHAVIFNKNLSSDLQKYKCNST